MRQPHEPTSKAQTCAFQVASRYNHLYPDVHSNIVGTSIDCLKRRQKLIRRQKPKTYNHTCSQILNLVPTSSSPHAPESTPSVFPFAFAFAECSLQCNKSTKFPRQTESGVHVSELENQQICFFLRNKLH